MARTKRKSEIEPYSKLKYTQDTKICDWLFLALSADVCSALDVSVVPIYGAFGFAHLCAESSCLKPRATTGF